MERFFGNIPVYWINLERSTDRKENMLKYLKNINNTRIEAIDGMDPEFNTKYTIINPNPAYSNALNAVICSHIKALNTAKIDDHPYVVILEDKCQFDIIELYKYTLEYIIDIANDKFNDWDIIQLSSIPVYQNFEHYKNNGLNLVPQEGAGLNYLINKKAIDKFISLVHNDGNYFNFSKIKFAYSPELAFYRSLRSYTLNNPPFYLYSKDSTFPKYFNGKTDEKLKDTAYKKFIDTKHVIKKFYDLE